jgi:hypothetical protein
MWGLRISKYMALKGKKITEEHKKKIGDANRGRVLSIESRRNMSLGQKGKISGAKGYKWTDEQRKRNSEAHLGKPSYWKGKKMSLKHRMKLSESHLGDKAGNWRGGISREEYTFDWIETLRKSIRERDNYMCQECGITQDELDGFHKQLDVHHIDYIKDNCNPENLISLCKSCHAKTSYNREYWIKHFIKD